MSVLASRPPRVLGRSCSSGFQAHRRTGFASTTRTSVSLYRSSQPWEVLLGRQRISESVRTRATPLKQDNFLDPSPDRSIHSRPGRWGVAENTGGQTRDRLADLGRLVWGFWNRGPSGMGTHYDTDKTSTTDQGAVSNTTGSTRSSTFNAQHQSDVRSHDPHKPNEATTTTRGIPATTASQERSATTRSMRLVDLFIDDKDVLSVLLRFLDYQDCKILSSIDRMSAQSPLRAKVFEHSVVRLPFPRLQEDQVDWKHYYTTTFMRGANPAMLEHITSVSIPHSNLAKALQVLPYLDTVCIWSVPRQALKDQQKRRRRRRENELRVVRVMNLHDFVDLTMLSDLHLHRSNVVAFPAIAQLTNLTSVDLSSARLEDTAHFKYLAMLPQLEKLNLCGTRVRDARFLRALDKLKWLDIEGTKISTLADLNHMHGLEYLNISDIWLQSGVISLVHMKALRQLLASYIGAFEPLSLDLDAPDLQKCDLRGSTVQHLEFLQKSPNLKSLDIRETRILNLTSIGALHHLKKLVLTANPVALRSVPWSELTLLEDLHVEKWHAAPAEYEVIDGSLFSSLRSLHTLQIEQMSDFSWIAFPSSSLKRVMMKTFSEHDEDRLVELASSVRLDTLHIRVQHRPPPFLALQALAPTLLELRLVDAVTEDFSVLAECVNLEMLDLTVRETSTWRSLPRNVGFQFLTKLQRLRVLWLTGRHDFKDVSLLKVLKKLEVLRLDRTRVTDVSAVATLTNLRQLSLDCTKITTVPDLHALVRLEAIGLPLNADCRVFHALGAFPKLREIWHEEGYNCFWTGHSLDLGSHK